MKIAFFVWLCVSMLFSATSVFAISGDAEVDIEYGDEETYLHVDNRSYDETVTLVSDYPARHNASLKALDESLAVYGYITDRPYQHGFVFVLDEAGEVVLDARYEMAGRTDVKGVYHSEDGIIVHVVESPEVESDCGVHEADHFFIYDERGEIASFRLEERQKLVREETALIFIGSQYREPFEHAVTFSGRLLEKGDIYVPHENDENASMVYAVGEGDISDIAFEYVYELTYPGHYDVRTGHDTQSVTRDVEVSGVEDGAVLKTPVKIEFKAGHGFLNDDVFKSGDTVEIPGHHTFRLEGIGGYALTKEFTVESYIEGIEENGIYDDAVTLKFSGEGFLNNAPVSSGVTVDAPGIYTFEVRGEGDYFQKYDFEIEDSDNMMFSVLEIGVAAVFLGGIVFLLYRYKRR